MSTQLTLIINSEKTGDQNALQYLRAIPGVEVVVLDLAVRSLTEDELSALAEKLAMPIEDMLDSDYDDHITVHTEGLRIMDRQRLLTLMTEDTKLIATPVVVLRDQAFMLGKSEGNDLSMIEMANRVLMFGYGKVE